MALQQCPYRAELRSEIGDLCGNVMAQGEDPDPPFLLLDPAWRKSSLEHQQCSEPSSRGIPDPLGTPGSPLRGVLGSGEVNILQCLTRLSKDKCSHHFEALRHRTAWAIKLIANFIQGWRLHPSQISLSEGSKISYNERVHIFVFST